MKRYKQLLKASDTFPLDIVEMNRGRTDSISREGFNTLEYLAFFRGGNLEYFVEENSCCAFSEQLIERVLANSNWRNRLIDKSKFFVNHVVSTRRTLCGREFTHYDNKTLAALFASIQNILYINGLEFHDEGLTASAFCLSLQNKIEDSISNLGLDPSKTLSTILKSDSSSPIELYESDVLKTALRLINSVPHTNNPREAEWEHIHYQLVKRIHDQHAWITAAWSGKGKSVEEVYIDVRQAMQVGKSSLGKKISNLNCTRQKAISKKKEVASQILNSLTGKERAIMEFAILSVELGRVRIDEIYKLIFYTRDLYTEIAARLSISVKNLRYLLRDEIDAALLTNSQIDTCIIEGRKKYTLIEFKGGDFDIVPPERQHLYEEQVAQPIDLTVGKKFIGHVAYSGDATIRGKARIILTPSDMGKMSKGDILISSRTYPDLLLAMKKASAIVTELGGILSHAAIVSRELRIPCVVGVSNITSAIKCGDSVEVDTNTGAIQILSETA